MFKKVLILFICICVSFTLTAKKINHNSAQIYGYLLSRVNKKPIPNAKLSLYLSDKLVAELRSDANGHFDFSNLKDGQYLLLIEAKGYLKTRVNVGLADGYGSNLYDINLSSTLTTESTAQKIKDNLDAYDFDAYSYQDSPILLYSQNDIFSNIAGYGFSPIRFRQRGYSSESQDVYLAGVRMNDAISSYGPFSLWSGLNDVVRSKTGVIGSEISDYGTGSYNGLVNIDPMASAIRKGWRGSVLTNSALYRLRFMLTYGSGVLDNGWSYAFSASARLGGNDWVRGAFYRSFAYYASVGKKFNNAHSLSFAIMASPGARGALAPSTDEVYKLYGSNYYNPNWGYQDNILRNARVKFSNEPISILKYCYTPSSNFELDASLLYRFGTNAYTALDWYDAPDPRPDYYRYLPSYFYDPSLGRDNKKLAAWAADSWKNRNPDIVQIDWDHFYYVNRRSEDQRSKYILQSRNVKQKDLNFALRTVYRYNPYLVLESGFNARLNRSENYASVYDLLGGKYFLNIDQFAERDFGSTDKSLSQNDLDYYIKHGSAQKVKKGDKYSYDYYANVRNANVWFTTKYNRNSWETAFSLSLAYNSMYRQGLVRRGIFPKEFNFDDVHNLGDKILDITSKGDSRKLEFFNYAAKFNLAYTFLGGHRLSMNILAMSQAPTFNQSFVSPRTRNAVVDNLKSANIYSTDFNYYYYNNGVKLRATAYYTRIFNQTSVRSYYDDLSRSFTNIALTGIDEKHEGIELGLSAPTNFWNLSIKALLSFGRYIYTSNPYITQTVDNSAKLVIDNEQLPYWKGYYSIKTKKNYIHHVPASPELAASLGLDWNYHYWFVEWNVNYFANNYISMNPLFRTDKAVLGPDGMATDKEALYMTGQEKFSPGFIMNLSIGKSWYIHYKYQLGLALNIQNLLNNTSIKTGGFESSRIIENTNQNEQYYRFDPKYFYMPGINYMFNVYFRF